MGNIFPKGDGLREEEINIGKYRVTLINSIGNGSFGTVFHATDMQKKKKSLL